MASDDNDFSFNFSMNDLDRNNTERDLYAILHIHKEVRKDLTNFCFISQNTL